MCKLQPHFSWKLLIKIFRMDLSQGFNMQSRSCHIIYICHFWRLARVMGLNIRKKPFIKFESDNLIIFSKETLLSAGNDLLEHRGKSTNAYVVMQTLLLMVAFRF